ncbi:DUF6525 family protein [Marivivens aquimaris]|uniref:DUF6525 family protein n=1 Tax=Marivivens aquimaris TaxID=2774876 RepID=UPI001D15F8BE|nr:DUF6525 family protein [Marivivens aquimaris]
MNGNLGRNGLRKRRRRNDPMRDFDALPLALRQWMAGAAMPWSPASCRRIWLRARSKGESVEAVLERLDRAERQCLGRERMGLVAQNLPTQPVAGRSISKN